MKRNLKKIFLLSLFLLFLLGLTACGKSKVEKVEAQMKVYLYEKYGEEFVVDRIGRRSANGERFYEARIYPKSIVGTPKEEDRYYYGSASIDVDSFGRLDKETGDDYSFINRNDDVEKYLLPKAKELFGERIRMKVDVNHEKTGGDRSFWIGYKSKSLEEMRENIKENPQDNRIILTLYIYIFDKIDNEEEKEERRKQLFEFLQYLRVEGLDKYLSIDCNFMDDIVLAPSFEENRYLLESDTNKVEKLEVVKKLREEVKKINEKQFLNNMEQIRKSEFKYEYGNLSINYNKAIMQILSLTYLIEI
ncbi:MAG: hypothetical protein JXM74_10950, partial [Fusobacteriaceae bacterium]|nr:hypothetical protein [Fusobacteriaceae bacterium]